MASYFAPVGHYAADGGYFAVGRGGQRPAARPAGRRQRRERRLRLQLGSAFPTNTFNAANYWVDVVFATGRGDGPGRADERHRHGRATRRRR